MFRDKSEKEILLKRLIRNRKCVVSVLLTLLIVFAAHLTGYADITPVSNRTAEVRDAIVAAVPGINNAADVTDAHLAAITSLNLRGKGISALETDDFSGLTALTSLNLYDNRLSNLPDGIFEGLTSLTTIRLSRNTIDPLPFTVSLEKIAEGEFKAVAPAGALFNIVLPITVTNGTITGDATTLTIPHGSVESSTLTVTRTAGTTGHVTVDIGTLPSLPRNHFGYALVKSDALPIIIISGANTAPVFTDGASTTRSVAENTTTGQHIGTAVAATDAENDTLTYTLSGTDATSFDIDTTSGQLQTKAALDYETKNTFTVTITVSDDSLTDSITVTINITDVHEVVAPPPNSAPVFTEGSSTTRSIPENTPTGQNIGTAVAATDADGHLLTYTISGTDAALFSIVSASGQLQTRAVLDYETKTSYTVTITTSDGSLTDSISVTINVTDMDETIIGHPFVPVADRTPEVRDAIVTAVPNLSHAADVSQAHVAAIRDLNLRNAGIIALKAGDFSDMTGLTSLNLFNNQLSSLPLGIFEGLTSLTTIRLGRNTVDPLPFIVSLEKIGAGAFKAVAPAGALFDIVLPITITNGSVTSGAATLTIPQGSMESGTFAVTRTAGTTAHVTVDIGKLPSLPRNHYGYALVKSDNLPLIIDRGSNTIPAFSEGITTTRSVAENSVRGVNIGDPVYATDADGDTLTYSLSGINASKFSIISSSGQLQTRASLDYESKTSYAVTVAVFDSFGGSDSITVTINVADVEENRAPVFSEGSTTTRSVAENTGANSNIGTVVTATDADNDTLTYTLGGTDAATFSIDSTNGQIKTKASLDYETKNTYSVILTVSDGHATDTIAVTINVTNIDENRAPMFSEGDTAIRSVAENTGANSNIGTAVAATDADNDTLTYTLGGTDAATFNIDSTTGQIKTKEALDYETKNTYSITLTVSDGLATDTIAVTIHVTDIDENRAPIFTEGSNATRKVAENATAGTNIGNAITATDPDNDTLTYSLGGQDASAFGIDTTTGQLRTNAALDYETKSIYSISVTASDSKLTATIAVTINITDIDELPDQVVEVKGASANNAPVFTDGSSTSRSVAENTGSGVDIGTPISATDADGHTLNYTLGGTDAASFSINSTTGQLRTNAVLDYEAKSIYSVSVTVSDGTLTDSITVTINVTDVNENRAPVFTDGTSTTRSVAENTGSGVDIGSAVSATDADGDTLTYTLGGTDNAAFSINSTTGQLRTNTALDYETKSVYTVSVTVSDGTLTAIIAVMISITDVDESPDQVAEVEGTADNNPPVFTDGTSTTRSVAENTGTGVDIGSAVSATDADGDTLTYTLGGTDAASFGINSTNGQLRTNAALDYETKTSYSVTITASDSNLTDSITVTINVTDVTEDVGKPGVSITVPSGVQNKAFDVTITFTEQVSDFEQDDLLITGSAKATITAWETTDNTVYTAKITPKSNGIVNVSVPEGVATDEAKNPNTAAAAQQVEIDLTQPSISFSLDLREKSQPGYYIGNGPFTMTIIFTEPVSGFEQSDLEIDDKYTYTDFKAIDAETINTVVYADTYTVKVIPDPNDNSLSFSIHIAAGSATDAAGNPNTSANSPRVEISKYRDNTQISVPDSVVETETFTVEVRFGVYQYSGPYQAFGFEQSELSLTNNTAGATITDWSTNDRSTVFTAEITVTQSGQVTFGVAENVATNLAGNGNTAAVQKTVTVTLADNPGTAPLATMRPNKTQLHANFPNPFNPETWIPYQLAKPAEVTLTIYNTRGVVVQTIVLGHQAAGVYTSRSRAIHWDGRNMFGEKVATGLYFYTLKAGDFSATRKMLIRK